MTPEERVELALRRVAARRAITETSMDRDPTTLLLIELADEIAKILKARGDD